MIENFSIGKARRTNVSVHDTFDFVKPGLVTSALIVKNTGHGFPNFLPTFFECCTFELG